MPLLPKDSLSRSLFRIPSGFLQASSHTPLTSKLQSKTPMKFFSLLSAILVLLIAVFSFHFLQSNCNQLSLFLNNSSYSVFGCREIQRNTKENDFKCIAFFYMFFLGIFFFGCIFLEVDGVMVQFWCWMFCRFVESEMVAVVAIVCGCGFGGEECVNIYERCFHPVRRFDGGSQRADSTNWQLLLCCSGCLPFLVFFMFSLHIIRVD